MTTTTARLTMRTLCLTAVLVGVAAMTLGGFLPVYAVAGVAAANCFIVWQLTK